MTQVNAPEFVRHPKLIAWVEEIAKLTKPAKIEWCDGSAEEYQKIASVIDDVFGELFKTNTIKEGAMFTIEFSPEHGVRLNYDEVGDLPYIKEEGFDQAILRAWLGDNPISLEMKKDLLGQH